MLTKAIRDRNLRPFSRVKKSTHTHTQMYITKIYYIVYARRRVRGRLPHQMFFFLNIFPFSPPLTPRVATTCGLLLHTLRFINLLITVQLTRPITAQYETSPPARSRSYNKIIKVLIVACIASGGDDDDDDDVITPGSYSFSSINIHREKKRKKPDRLEWNIIVTDTHAHAFIHRNNYLRFQRLLTYLRDGGIIYTRARARHLQ